MTQFTEIYTESFATRRRNFNDSFSRQFGKSFPPPLCLSVGTKAQRKLNYYRNSSIFTVSSCTFAKMVHVRDLAGGKDNKSSVICFIVSRAGVARKGLPGSGEKRRTGCTV